MSINSKFIGKAVRLTAADYRNVAADLQVELPALMAVIDVESAEYGFYNTGAMVMLYEPHIAYKRTTGKVRTDLVKAGVAYAKWGTRKYPKNHADRYAQLE